MNKEYFVYGMKRVALFTSLQHNGGVWKIEKMHCRSSCQTSKNVNDY